MAKYLKTPFAQAFFFAFCYGVLFYILQFVFVRTHMLGTEPTLLSLKSSDVAFYDSIREGGYLAREQNPGFFILFPLIWRLTHLNAWGIVALNVAFFAAGFAIVSRLLKEENRIFWLLLLTLPSVFFAFVPYTEALFFLLAALLLYAVYRKNYKLLWLSLFIISFVRATGVFLFPAFLAMELFTHPLKDWYKSIARACFLYGLPLALGLGIFIWWQYLETGIWFVYFKIQAKNWDHHFSFPTLPLRNIENGDWRYHWLNALAILADSIALSFMIYHFVRWIRQKQIAQNGVLFICAGYMTMALFSILLMNPRFGDQTNIMGAHRYTIMTPFFFVLLHHWSRRKYTPRQILYIFLAINAFWALFGAYEDLDKFIAIAVACDLMIIAFLFHYAYKKYDWLIVPVIAFNFFMQVHLFQLFISNVYVD